MRLPSLTSQMLAQFRQQPRLPQLPSFNMPSMQMPQMPGLPQQQQQPLTAEDILNQQAEQMTPEEEKSLLGSAVSGLTYLGETVDKPFAAVRGVIHGLTDLLQGETPDWGGGLMNLVPFSDSRGWTDPAERKTGRDILANWGAAANVKGFHPIDDPWDATLDVAGLAIELFAGPPVPIGTPLTALGRGTQKAAGALAKGVKAGEDAVKALDDITPAVVKMVTGKATEGKLLATTPKAIAEQVRTGQRSLAGLQMPFGTQWMHGGTGTTLVQGNLGLGAENAAKLIEAASYGKYSLLPPLRAMFTGHLESERDRAAQLAIDMSMQDTLDRAGGLMSFGPVYKQASDQLKTKFAEYADFAEEMGDIPALNSWDSFARYIAEWKNPAGKGYNRDEVVALFNTQKLGPEKTKALGVFADQVLSMTQNHNEVLANTLHGMLKEWGGNASDLQDFYSAHLARRHLPEELQQMYDDIWQRKKFSVDNPFGLARQDVLRSLPGGTVTAHELSKADNIVGFALKSDAEKRESVQAMHDWLTANVPNSTPPPLADVLKGDKAAVDELMEEFVAQRYLWPHADKQSVTAASNEWKRLREGLTEPDDLIRRAVDFQTDADLLIERQRGAWVESAEDANFFVRRGLEEKSLARIRNGDHPIKSAAGELVDYFSELDPAQMPNGMFSRTVVQDQLDYLETLGEAVSTHMAMHRVVRGSGIKLVADPKIQMPGLVPITDAWGAPKSAGHNARPLLSRRGLEKMARDWAIEKKMFDDVPNLRGYVDAVANGQPAHVIEDLEATVAKELDPIIKKMRVPQGVGKVLKAHLETAKAESDVLGIFGEVYRDFQALFKVGATTPWPAFNVRNYISGQWMNLAAESPYNWRQYKQAYKDFKAWRSGKVDNLDYLDEMDLLGLDQSNRMTELTGVEGLREGVPKGTATGGYLKALFTKKNYTTLNMRGQSGSLPFMPKYDPTKPQLVVAQAGEEAYKRIEALNRVPAYMAARRAGQTPQQALDFVHKVQYDYSKLSKFEKKYMRNIIPFYGWISNNTPRQLQQLFMRPGGKSAATLRMIGSMQRESESGWMPRYIKERMGMRVGGPDENALIMSSLGLPPDSLSTFVMKDDLPNPRRTVERLTSSASPLITGPLKWLFGKDLYSGRPIKELKGPFKSPGLNTAFFASPFGRTYSTYGQATDERKPMWARAVNLTTGVKFTTVDLHKQRLYELQKANAEDLEASKYIREGKFYYIPRKFKAIADEQTERSRRLHQALANQIRKMSEDERLKEAATAKG